MTSKRLVNTCQKAKYIYDPDSAINKFVLISSKQINSITCSFELLRCKHLEHTMLEQLEFG